MNRKGRGEVSKFWEGGGELSKLLGGLYRGGELSILTTISRGGSSLRLSSKIQDENHSLVDISISFVGINYTKTS